MELNRGFCSLCSENTRVLPPADNEEFTKYLPQILYENFLPDTEFQKIKSLLKICGICCYKIQIAAETRNLICNEKGSQLVNDKTTCHFCKTDKCLLKVDKNWKYFIDRAEGFFSLNDFPSCVCPKCLFYFDMIFTMKTKLSYKFPQLAIQKRKANGTPQNSNDTPKRKSVSKSPPSSKKRKIFDNCFTYLQPLCTNKYDVDEKLKQDKRLYRKIAYVDLKNWKNIDVKETPKLRPVIKIKLKQPRSKKGRKEVVKSESVVKVLQSEKAPSKSEKSEIESGNPEIKTTHSYADHKKSSEEPGETLNDTPKSASVENLVPRRRVSEYMDNSDNEEKKDEDPEQEEVKEIPDEPSPAADEESSDCTEEIKDNVDVDSNGIDKLDDHRDKCTEESTDPVIEVPEETVNGQKPDSQNQNEEKQDEPQITFDISESSSNSSKSPIKCDSNSEVSDTDSLEAKDTSILTSESDVLNGSERKKKRVTFSDEINN